MEILESLLVPRRELRGCARGGDPAADFLGRYNAYRQPLRFHVDNRSNRCDAYSVSPGMVMAVVDVACTDGFESRLSGQDIVEFHFRLSGSIVLGGAWGEVCIRDPSFLLWYQPAGCDDVEERMGVRERRERWVSLYCDRTWLGAVGGGAAAHLLDVIPPGRDTRLAPRYRVCPQIGPIVPLLKDIVSLDRHEPPDWLLAIAKAHELLFITLRHAVLLTADAESGVRLTERDIRQIALARGILATEFVTPPNLPALARRVGINTSKLCCGFKKQYGETTSEYVRRLRLELARELLGHSDLQVRQIARRTGYQHHSTFTAAFARHFGVAPKFVRSPRGALN